LAGSAGPTAARSAAVDSTVNCDGRSTS